MTARSTSPRKKAPRRSPSPLAPRQSRVLSPSHGSRGGIPSLAELRGALGVGIFSIAVAATGACGTEGRAVGDNGVQRATNGTRDSGALRGSQAGSELDPPMYVDGVATGSTSASGKKPPLDPPPDLPTPGKMIPVRPKPPIAPSANPPAVKGGEMPPVTARPHVPPPIMPSTEPRELAGDVAPVVPKPSSSY